jgi:cholest-4-en-3-one 26-monooxygenase
MRTIRARARPGHPLAYAPGDEHERIREGEQPGLQGDQAEDGAQRRQEHREKLQEDAGDGHSLQREVPNRPAADAPGRVREDEPVDQRALELGQEATPEVSPVMHAGRAAPREARARLGPMSREPLPGTLEVIGPDTFAERGYPHAAWKRLREEAPVHHFDLPGGVGFWAIVKREDIVRISKQPERFLNAPRLAIFEEGAPVEGERRLARHLLNMDPPEHAEYRKAASHWFTPRAIRRREPEVERIARDLFAGMAGDGGDRTGDFVADLAAPLTLHVLADMLGVPRADWKLLFRWTNQIAGASDAEYRQSEDPMDGIEEARHGLFAYFTELAAERRQQPRDDMVSVLANATVGGAPIAPFELLSYFLLLVVAGNETTRNAASGGLLALIEHPEERRRLAEAPRLVPTAVEEIVRWTSPVIQFCRTPVEDVELRGQKIRKGESLCLLYPSANRDADAFPDPESFRVDRRPNPHLGFGIGEHFCLGANLARLELRVIFAELARRLEDVELAGPVERMRSSFLGGVKRMPIRYRLRPA